VPQFVIKHLAVWDLYLMKDTPMKIVFARANVNQSVVATV
jgi:hypothetical protein